MRLNEAELHDLYYTLAKIIHPALVQFKNSERYSYPFSFTVLYDEEEARQRWEEAIDKMIWSFEQIVNETDYYFPSISADSEEWKNVAEYHSKLEEGFKLFGEYYTDLWD